MLLITMKIWMRVDDIEDIDEIPLVPSTPEVITDPFIAFIEEKTRH